MDTKDEKVNSEIDNNRVKTEESVNNNIKPTPNMMKLARLILFGGTALILFIVFFIIFWNVERKHITDKSADVIIMGDSFFANSIGESSISARLTRKLNRSVADLSFGGTCISYIDRSARLDNATDAFCMSALTQAIMTEDFRYQENAYINLFATDYYDDRLAELKHIDFSEADILIIDYLLNDYQIAVPVNCGTDRYDEYTFEGAYRSVLSQIKKKYPELRIVLVAPAMTWYGEDNIPSTEMNHGGGTIESYIECQKEIAEEFGVEWISLLDLYEKSAVSDPELLKDDDGKDIDLWAAFTTDYIHPNEIARELIADYLYSCLADGE